MATPAPAVPYRLLPAAQTLLGAAGSLENILDPLASGALCWVLDQGALYAFSQYSTAAVSLPSVIATARGAGVPGRWIRYVAASSGLPFTNGFWVDLGAAPGGNGSAISPFNTVTDAVAACPTGGTILILPGDYSGEPDIVMGTKSMSFIAQAGQSGLTRVILPEIGHASGGTVQHLAFRNLSVRVTRTGASTTALYFDYCPSVTLSGAGNNSQVITNGDFSCALAGNAGQLLMRGGFLFSYTAIGPINVQGVAIGGDLVASSGIAIQFSAWTESGHSVTAPAIFFDLATAFEQRASSTTTSVTPSVQEAHNATAVFPAVLLAVGTSDVAIDVTGTPLAGIDVGDAAFATWGAPGPSGFGDAAIGGCQVTALNEVTVRFVGVVGGGNSDIILTWPQSP